MITLRQGKAKTILENSLNSALTAVETYNTGLVMAVKSLSEQD